MKRSEILFGFLRLPIDLLAAFAALIAANLLRAERTFLPSFFRSPDLESFPSFNTYLILAAIGALGFVFIAAFFGLYAMRSRDSYARQVRKVATASLVWLMAVISYYFFLRAFPFSRLVLFYATAFVAIFVSAGRLLVSVLQKALLARGIGQRHVVFVGDNAITRDLTKLFSRTNEVHIIGVVKDNDSLAKLVTQKKRVDEVIQTYDDHEMSEQIISFCREHHIQYHFVPDLLEVYRTNIEIASLGDIPLISLKPIALDGWGTVLKRIFDIVVSTILLILLSPVFLLITIAIKLDSRGTVFFKYLDDGTRAKRVGERGDLFGCLKFRTMQSGTHNMRYTKLADRNTRKDSPLVKIKDDPRVTRVGKILRKYSLDELPQLWNVLIGEMSLVGPRPHLPEEVARYDHHHKFVLAIKPGITGLAQISGRSDLAFEKEVKLDTYYIEKWSLWMDIKILIKTVGVVVKPYKE